MKPQREKKYRAAQARMARLLVVEDAGQELGEEFREKHIRPAQLARVELAVKQAQPTLSARRLLLVVLYASRAACAICYCALRCATGSSWTT